MIWKLKDWRLICTVLKFFIHTVNLFSINGNENEIEIEITTESMKLTKSKQTGNK